MSRNLTRGLFLGTCVVLALLLWTGTITPIVSGSVFAIALVLYGVLTRRSRGNDGA